MGHFKTYVGYVVGLRTGGKVYSRVFFPVQQQYEIVCVYVNLEKLFLALLLLSVQCT